MVWNCTGSGVRLNSDALNHQVYNNTIQQVREPFGTYTYAAYTPTMKGTRIINNLVNEAIHPKNPWEFVQGPLGPELHHNGPGHLVSAAVDPGQQPEEELADPVGLVVHALENLTFDLHGHDPMAVGGFEAKFTDLEFAPSDELAGRPRAFTSGPTDADGDRYQTGLGRGHDRVAEFRILTPQDPTSRIAGRPKVREHGLEHREDFAAHALAVRGRLPPLAQKHRLASPITAGTGPRRRSLSSPMRLSRRKPMRNRTTASISRRMRTLPRKDTSASQGVFGWRPWNDVPAESRRVSSC